jgi:hypothetical protein
MPSDAEAAKTAAAKMVKHIVIVGHSGAGKSTLASKLAKKLGWPIFKTDNDPLWKYEGRLLADGDEWCNNGTKVGKRYREICAAITDKALKLKEPHVIEGCQPLFDKDKLDGHRVILVNPSLPRIVKQRLDRDYEIGKLNRYSKIQRLAKAHCLHSKLEPFVAKFRDDHDVEKTHPKYFEDWLKRQPPTGHQPTLAIDLDGTMVRSGPWQGPDHFAALRDGVKRGLKELCLRGYKLIVWTCRGDKEAVRDWIKENRLPIKLINENPNQPPDTSEKIYSDGYIDDRSIDGSEHWDKIPDMIDEKVMKLHNKVKPQLPVLMKKSDDAKGIPDRQDYGRLEQLAPGQLLTFLRQRHDAARAGVHEDIRLGDKDKGLFSWAARKGLPKPGKKHLAVQQPLHSFDYKDFQGTIPKGSYGAGTVKKEHEGPVLITKVSPGEIHFTDAKSRHPSRFLLKQTKDKNWLLINTTKTEAIPHAKLHYAKIPAEKAEEVLGKLEPGSSAQAKVDGAASLSQLLANHAEVISYRTPKTRADSGSPDGLPIVHTERFFHGRPTIKLPSGLSGTVLRGELYGQNQATGKVIPPQELGGLLNSGVAKSITDQKARGVQLKNMVFDIQQLGKKPIGLDTPYAERLQKVRDVLKHLPATHFHAPEEAKTPEEAVKLWKDVTTGKHHLTHEGVVVHPATGKPFKIKKLEEHDVHIRDFFPGKGKYEGTGVGGFRYSMTPDGPVLGEVGTGLSDELRQQMHKSPREFVGRIAKVRAQGAFPGSGALRGPALLSLHEDLPLADVKEAAAALPEGTPTLIQLSLRNGPQTICPRCNKPVKSSLYRDAKGWTFHRSCFRNGMGPVREV